MRKERSSFRGTLERGAVRHGLICISGRPPPPLLRPLRPLRPLPPPGRCRGGAGTPGEGRAQRRREREAGRAGFCGSAASRAAPAPGPQPGRTGQCALPLPARADSRRPPPRPPPSRPPPSPPPAALPPPPAPPPARPARTRAEAARCHSGWGGDERPGPPSPAAHCAPHPRARVGATGDAAGVRRRGPGPPAGGVSGSHARLPRSVLAARAEPPRGTSRLAAGPAPPGVPCGARIPGASVASGQEGPEVSSLPRGAQWPAGLGVRTLCSRTRLSPRLQCFSRTPPPPPKGFLFCFNKLTPLSDLCCKALGGNDRHRTGRLWQDVEPRCHSGRDETVTGRGRGRRTRLPR